MYTQVMQHIWDVIKNILVPAWVNSVPRNFGKAAAGSLKADKWHTIITIYLLIALVTNNNMFPGGSISQTYGIQFPTNHKFGVLESTLLHTFNRASKLKLWVVQTNCPPAIKEAKRLLDKWYRSPGTRVNGQEFQTLGSELGLENHKTAGMPMPLDLRHLL
ncbi:hypothetical protein SERLADRAFT_405887 [Serpula lacrymans var. lacrymans S7.9]|uniref:Uncharacterized protein n=1 Tax=Serpula lacrymans var. lacrymans (strain S7.9) TaxID=578457 RepID=F8NJR6_SERL9|nr:uncharacterized protein SERLADRAFT_405887 [Serpula lacrymans var. lacrymans S7.9]EGO28281.1 hypothetical protein SERLADRAFT_405887 [Serpula lacrymans var. lacrymans S7.9]